MAQSELIDAPLASGIVMASLNNGVSFLGAQYHVYNFVKVLVINFAVLMDKSFKHLQKF